MKKLNRLLLILVLLFSLQEGGDTPQAAARRSSVDVATS